MSMKRIGTQRDAEEYIIEFETLDRKFVNLPEATKKGDVV